MHCIIKILSNLLYVHNFSEFSSQLSDIFTDNEVDCMALYMHLLKPGHKKKHSSEQFAVSGHHVTWIDKGKLGGVSFSAFLRALGHRHYANQLDET